MNKYEGGCYTHCLLLSTDVQIAAPLEFMPQIIHTPNLGLKYFFILTSISFFLTGSKITFWVTKPESRFDFDRETLEGAK